MASDIHFGTDGWRAIIGEDFTVDNLVKVVDAAARTFKAAAVEAGAQLENPGVLYVGHDCRQDAHIYASIAALTAAEHGFDVKLTEDYCPTPTLCWSVAHDPEAVGGIMLTSSHNPAEYLGVKLRMADGGASPKEFTDIVEEVMEQTAEPYTDDPAIAALAKLDIADIKPVVDEAKLEAAAVDALAKEPQIEAAFEIADAGDVDDATKVIEATVTTTPVVDVPALILQMVPVEAAETKPVQTVDLMTPYLEALKELVDVDAIRAANLHVVIDPLFGAGRGYLAGLLRDMGVQVTEIDNAEDPTFDGLHPEPIPPWVDRGLAKVAELGADALFINDGDADRIGAGDSQGNFVNPHRIITLVTKHMVDRGETGRVVSTITASALLDRLCRKLGLELVSTPVGFKWIYGEMEKGGVMIGGEESGGIGLPGHVKERDGLLMALLLTEMMAQSGKDLGTLVQEMLDDLGTLEFTRRGLTVTDEQMKTFREETIPNANPMEINTTPVIGVDRRDGVKFLLEGDAWVMMRPSGTEPLVRIYAEAATTDKVDQLLDWAEKVVCC